MKFHPEQSSSLGSPRLFSTRDKGKPEIISSFDGGIHNANLGETVRRLDKAATWRDLSTVIIIPAGGSVPTKVLASWMNMMSPPNNKVARLFATGMEVGAAYSMCIENILGHPDLGKWKYILTIEHDNVVPSDGFVKLLERMEEHPEMDAIGGLYFTKGPGGVAQIWGDPNEHPINFRPQLPTLDGSLKECCGTGMGFTLFRMSMFRDEKLRRPWFKTTASITEGAFSQDLYFWQDARQHGHRCAIDCSVKVGHYSMEEDITW